MPVALSIVTPEQTLVDTLADSIVAPGAEGEFGVLPAHEPFLAPLQAGELRYESGGESHAVEITGGFAEVTQERVTVLAQLTESTE